MAARMIPLSMDGEFGDPREALLARALGALASPARLALLRELRNPKALREIEVRAQDPHSGAGGTRVMSRQAVREHLDRLLEIGVVVSREAERDYGLTVEYLLNNQTLFALSEEFRSLARLHPTTEPDAMTVVGAPSGAVGRGDTGPCLVLVKGINEGRTFDLRPPPSGRREWVIGRRRGLEVALDFDPFVSSENASVVWEDGSHFLVDLPESRNGTLLNFRALSKGARQPLRTGDLVGVGRSLLLFRE